MSSTYSTLATHRFNWMGTEHSQSSMQVLNLLREDGTNAKGNSMKYKSLEARKKAAESIRKHLAQIKREMDLEAQGLDPNTSEETQKAAEETTSLIRGSRYRSGEQLVSYIDGSVHDNVQGLRRYNSHCRPKLDDVVHANPKEDITLPDASIFEGTEVDLAMKDLADANDALAAAKEKASTAEQQSSEEETTTKKEEEQPPAAKSEAAEEKKDEPAAEEEKKESDEAAPVAEEEEKKDDLDATVERKDDNDAEDKKPSDEEEKREDTSKEEEKKDDAPTSSTEEEPAQQQEEEEKKEPENPTAKEEQRVADCDAALTEARLAYNEKAGHSSRYLLSFGCIRRAELSEGYDAHATDRVL